ncbi:MAG: HlyD family efflux transporter periplasmic adaptor subunit [Candidatus Pacebacteria bacterium]|nr:HlyD family efflux transporter periplasmic adaptor subunit [Candidatus Paceibacterota bacterium]
MPNNEKKKSLLEESREGVKSKKNIYIGIAVSIVILPFLFALTTGGDDTEDVEIKTAVVRKENIVLSVFADGRVVAASDIDLNFTNPGMITEILVEEGDVVEADQMLAKQDTEEAYLSLAQAKANLSAAEANLRSKLQTSGVSEIALQKEIVSSAELALEVAELDLENAKKELLEFDSEKERDKQDVYERLVVELGTSQSVLDNALQTMNATLSINPGKTTITIVSLFGDLNSEKRNEMFYTYITAQNKSDAFAEEFFKQKFTIDYNVLYLLTVESIDIARATSQALQSALGYLNTNSPTSAMTQTAFVAFVNSLQTEQTKVKAEILSLINLKQEIENFDVLTQEEKNDLEDDVEDLVLKVEIARQNINVANAQLVLKEDSVSDDALASLNAQITQTQVAVDIARKKYNDLILFTPVSGVVVEMNYGIGEVTDSDRDTPVIVVANSDGIMIEVFVEEADIAKVEKDQKAILTFGSFDDLELNGVVTYVADRSTIDNNGIVTYQVHVIGVDADERIREGMTTYVDLISSGVQDVLVIPVATVKPRDGKPSVQLKSGEWVPVTTGFTDGKKVEVISGLKKGDVVLYE